jgi:hypothetical protein
MESAFFLFAGAALQSERNKIGDARNTPPPSPTTALGIRDNDETTDLASNKNQRPLSKQGKGLYLNKRKASI